MLLPGDLTSSFCPPHPTSTYTCGVTITPKVCSGVVEVVSGGDWLILVGGWWW